MVLARDLKNGREGGGIGVDSVADFVGNVLVDEDNTNVFPLLGELCECSLNRCSLRLVVDD
jgi:hypothetical protein